MVMKDATPLTPPPRVCLELNFEMLTTYNPGTQETYNYTMMLYAATIYKRHTNTKHRL